MPAPDPKRLRRATVCGVAFDDRGRVLLHQRTDFGTWALPGGAIETGQTAESATVREMKEETGYDVRVTRLTGIYSNPPDTTVTYPNRDVVAYVNLCFECAVIGGAPALSDETSAIEWFDINGLPERIHPSHVIRIRDAATRQTAAFYR